MCRLSWVTLIAIGCVSLSRTAAAQKITNFEAIGNLEATKPVACIGLDKLTNQHTPADIFPSVRMCIDEGKFANAADLLAFAGVYGRFDTLRVADISAHQAIDVLRMNTLSSVEEAGTKSFQEVVRSRFATGSKELSRLCKRIKSIGAPGYQPIYMLQHGMGAITGEGGGIKSGFNEVEAWESSLDGYLHCPK